MQKGLFEHLNLNTNAMAQAKELIKKVNNPTVARKTITVSGTQGKQAHASKIFAIQEQAIALLGELRKKRPNHNFELITTKERLIQYQNKILENKFVCYDTEGSGLDPIDDFTCGFCLYTPGENPSYVPFNHTHPMTGEKYPNQLSEEDAKEFAEWLTHVSQNCGVKVILANAKYDLRITKNTFNLPAYIKPAWDDILAFNFLNENEKHKALKTLWDKFVNGGDGKGGLKFDDIFGKNGFNHFDPNKVYMYAAYDGLITFEVYEFEIQFLDGESELCISQNLVETSNLVKMETELIEAISYMEDTGICIDDVYSDKLSVKYNKKLQDSIADFSAALKQYDLSKLPMSKREKLGAPDKIVSSPAQLAIVLYDVLKLPQIDGRGTGEDIISALAKKHVEHEKLFSAILDFRGNSKLLTTYIEKMPKLVKKKTGKLHATFNQYGAATGRFSSKDPNLQNIPSKNTDIRPMFIASKGYVMIGSDYSQQEPRLLAFVSGDKNMIQAYLDGKDLYATVAEIVYKIPYEQNLEHFPDGTVNKDGKKRRTSMKSVVLGLMYGRGAQAIADQLNITKQEAQAIIDNFFDGFPKVKEFIDWALDFAKKNGYIQTVWGRKRRLPDINLPAYTIEMADGSPMDEMMYKQIWYELDGAWGKKRRETIGYYKKMGYRIKDNGGFISEAERQVVNTVMQGSAADMTKQAMLDAYQDEELKRLGYRMLIPVHDEILGEAPEENAIAARDRIVHIMVNAAAKKVTVPMKCDPELTRGWYHPDITEEIEGKYAV